MSELLVQFDQTEYGASLGQQFDDALNDSIRQAKQVPVLINYTVNGKRAEKTLDAFDLELIEKIENSEIPYWFPADRMMEGKETAVTILSVLPMCIIFIRNGICGYCPQLEINANRSFSITF